MILALIGLLKADRSWLKRISLTLCEYDLGRQFLISLYYTMGHDAMTSALVELFLESERNETRPMEEEVYRTFLKRTPPGAGEEVRVLYEKLHGGPFADSGN